jgi:hypothetical protein
MNECIPIAMIDKAKLVRIIDQARNVLITNLRTLPGEQGVQLFAVPSAKLYPAAWGWDTPKIGAGLSLFQPEQALQLIESFLGYQWQNGMIPHIVFPGLKDGEKLPAQSYFPPPHVWYYEGTAPVDYAALPPSAFTSHPNYIETKGRTTAISQYPVWASILRFMAGTTTINRERLTSLLEKIEKSHQFFYRECDPLKWGIVAEFHPWIGCDNAPPYIDSLHRIASLSSAADLALIHSQRVDLKVTIAEGRDVATRPTDRDYYAFLMIAHSLARAMQKALRENRAVSVADLLFCSYSPMLNGILLRGETDLAAIAIGNGEQALAERALSRADALRKAMVDRLWEPESNTFFYYDAITSQRWSGDFIGTCLPIMDLQLPTAIRSALISTIKSKYLDGIRYPIPTTPPQSPDFNRMQYWLGPTWLTTNYMVFLGLEDQTELQSLIRKRSLELIVESGFREYFDGQTGIGYGADNFGWTASYAAIFARQELARIINVPNTGVNVYGASCEKFAQER